MEIEGRVAVVTGAGHRVGRGIALALAGAGADVLVHHHRSVVEAEATVEAVRRLGRRSAAVGADLADPSSAAKIVDAAVAELGAATILVNSASGFPGDGLGDVTPERWQATLDVTLTAPVFVTQAFAARLPDGAGGAVVNVTDVRTAAPYRRHFSYTVAKGGVDTFTRAAALALAPEVRVNAVALGVILPPSTGETEHVGRLVAGLPLRREGGVEPVADMVVSLVGNDFVTGEIVRIDGGGHLV